MKQSDLKNGIEFNFDNEKWCEETFSDDFRSGWIEWNNRLMKFAVFFNGTCVHTSKTFKSAEAKVNNLLNDWNCEFTEEVTI